MGLVRVMSSTANAESRKVQHRTNGGAFAYLRKRRGMKISNARFFTPEERDRILEGLPFAVTFIRMVSGMANALAFLVLGNCRERMRPWKRYKFDIKAGFERSIQLEDQYDMRMLTSPHGIFDFNELEDEYKEKYREDLTSKEYYEFWKASCSQMFTKVWPIIQALSYKYYKSLKSHDIEGAEYMQWALTGTVILELAQAQFTGAMMTLEQENKIPRFVLDEVVGCFSIKELFDQWTKTAKKVVPIYELTKDEEANIALSLKQIQGMMSDNTIILQSMAQNIKAWSNEIMRSQRLAKKTSKNFERLAKEQ